MEILDHVLWHLPFRDAVAAFPIAVAVHVAEEWPRFPRWVRRVAASGYSDREYVVTHAAAIAAAAVAAAALRRFPAEWLVFGFFAFVFGPGVCVNAFFHAGASLMTRTYCPGVVTGVVVYLPLAAVVAGAALGEGLISPSALGVALLVGTVVHTGEVGHTVFKRW